MTSITKRIQETVTNALFPRKCPLCGSFLTPVERICARCADNLVYINRPICARCGKPIFDCECREGDYIFERSVSPFVYTKAARSGIHRLKFDKKESSAVFFAKMMALVVKREYSDYNIHIVTSVPLHRDSEAKRGFNQSALLANGIAKDLELKVNNNILVKSAKNAVQHSLSRQDKLRNVKDVYRVARPDLIHNRTVLLCDDVMTTGSTLNECARVLLEAGAARVICVTACSVCESRQGGMKRALI